jgi:hypothetical protein
LRQGLTEWEAYRKYFQPFVHRGELDTSPTMLLGAMTSGPKALLQWLGVVTWFPALAPPEDSKTAVAGGPAAPAAASADLLRRSPPG